MTLSPSEAIHYAELNGDERFLEGVEVGKQIRQGEEGGPAFPNPGHDNGPGNYRGRPVEGMSLRDYFAAKAMQGLVASTTDGEYDEKMVASSAWEMADAMLSARTPGAAS